MATKTPTQRDPDLDVITWNIRRSPVPQRQGGLEPTPQDRVIDYRRKMEPYWNGALFPGKLGSITTQKPDNNDNVSVIQTQQTQVKHCTESMHSKPQAAPQQTRKEDQQVGLRKIGDHEYHEEEPLGSDTQEPYLASNDSLIPWYYRYSVPDLADFHTYEEETDDITVVDVFNTNQELRLGEGSSTEPSGDDDRDSSGEDGFELKEN